MDKLLRWKKQAIATKDLPQSNRHQQTGDGAISEAPVDGKPNARRADAHRETNPRTRCMIKRDKVAPVQISSMSDASKPNTMIEPEDRHGAVTTPATTASSAGLDATLSNKLEINSIPKRSNRSRSRKPGRSVFCLKSPPPSEHLKKILANYPEGPQIFQEGLQNADDAGATIFRVILDERSATIDAEESARNRIERFVGPALLLYNDEVFTDKDWNSLQRMYESEKASETWKIGKFGLGSRSYFHVSDVITVLSGDRISFLDPDWIITDYGGGSALLRDIVKPEKSGLQENYDIDNIVPFLRELLKPFNGIMGIHPAHCEHFKGTIFRLPLRSSTWAEQSSFAPYEYTPEKALNLLEKFSIDMPYSLIFLQCIRTVELWRLREHDPHPWLLSRCTISPCNLFHETGLSGSSNHFLGQPLVSPSPLLRRCIPASEQNDGRDCLRRFLAHQKEQYGTGALWETMHQAETGVLPELNDIFEVQMLQRREVANGDVETTLMSTQFLIASKIVTTNARLAKLARVVNAPPIVGAALQLFPPQNCLLMETAASESYPTTSIGAMGQGSTRSRTTSSVYSMADNRSSNSRRRKRENAFLGGYEQRVRGARKKPRLRQFRMESRTQNVGTKGSTDVPSPNLYHQHNAWQSPAPSNNLETVHPRYLQWVLNEETSIAEKDTTGRSPMEESTVKLDSNNHQQSFTSGCSPLTVSSTLPETQLSNQQPDGRVYAYLPLPDVISGLPIHVHGRFQLMDNRRSIWTVAHTLEGQARKWAQWNELLLREAFPPLYAKLLSQYADIMMKALQEIERSAYCSFDALYDATGESHFREDFLRFDSREQVQSAVSRLLCFYYSKFPNPINVAPVLRPTLPGTVACIKRAPLILQLPRPMRQIHRTCRLVTAGHISDTEQSRIMSPLRAVDCFYLILTDVEAAAFRKVNTAVNFNLLEECVAHCQALGHPVVVVPEHLRSFLVQYDPDPHSNPAAQTQRQKNFGLPAARTKMITNALDLLAEATARRSTVDSDGYFRISIMDAFWKILLPDWAVKNYEELHSDPCFPQLMLVLCKILGRGPEKYIHRFGSVCARLPFVPVRFPGVEYDEHDLIPLRAPMNCCDITLEKYRVGQLAQPDTQFRAPDVLRVLRKWGLKQTLEWREVAQEAVSKVCVVGGCNAQRDQLEMCIYKAT